jgi:hypothetical protein
MRISQCEILRRIAPVDPSADPAAPLPISAEKYWSYTSRHLKFHVSPREILKNLYKILPVDAYARAEFSKRKR